MDLRYAFRVLFRSPGFTAIAVLTLALGIGINTIVFTLYSSVALKPIAARAPHQLVRITGNQNGQRLDLFSWSQFDQIRSHTKSFSDVIASSELQILMGRIAQALPGASETLHARLVSNNYFNALGVTLKLGRGLLADDREVAVVSHDFWAKKLDADPNALGKSIQVRGTVLHIVGVAPERFAGTGLPPQMPDLWVPASVQVDVLPGVDWMHDPNARVWQIVGRRLSSVRVEQASAELEVLAGTWPLVNGQAAHLSARPATFFQTDAGEFEVFGAICGILMIAVGLILLIGSINLVNLLFARHAAREREFAVRRALGAGRLRLVRQLCTESLLLGVLGGGVGLLFSLWACEWIQVEITGILQRITGGVIGVFLDVSPDWYVFAFSAAISLITGVAIGVWPSIKASRPNIGLALKQASAGPAGGRRKRNFLITAQVAACLVLLAGAGLLFRGVWRSGSIDVGFDMRHVLIVGMDARTVASNAAAQAELRRHVAERIATVPGVSLVGWAARAPFLGHGTAGFENERSVSIACLFNLVSERYFETLSIPVVAGRNFSRLEMESEAPVVVINEVAARQAWPGQDPIGHRVSGLGWLKRQGLSHDSYTVIGVVKGVRSTFLSKPDEPFLYFPKRLSQDTGTLLVRTLGTPESVSHSVLAELAAIDRDLPSQTILVPLDKAPVEIQKMMAEAPATVALMLGALALLLASLGVFGVVSQLVTQRTREIAIRVSLGAQQRDVVRIIMTQTLRPVIFGSVFGLAGAFAISGLLAKMLAAPDMPDLTYGSGAFDPLTFLAVLAVLTAVVLIASMVPVRRAIQIAPAEALRNE